MNLNCETILDFYTHKNKKILCQIKVTPPKSGKFQNTCRSLTQENWNKFDKKLEKLITNIENWNIEKFHTFNIKPYIEVKVNKSKLSPKHFILSLGEVGDSDKNSDGDALVDADYVLEILFCFKTEPPFNSPIIESNEYDTQINVSLKETLLYESYTPLKEKYNADNIDTSKTSSTEYLMGFEEDIPSSDGVPLDNKTETPLFDKKHKHLPISFKFCTRDCSRETSPCDNNLLSGAEIKTENEIVFESKIKSTKRKEVIGNSTKTEETSHRKHKESKTLIDVLLPQDKEFTKKHKSTKEQVDSKEKEEVDSKEIRKQFRRLYKTIDENTIESTVNVDKYKLKTIFEDSRNKPLLSKNKAEITKSNNSIYTTKSKAHIKTPEKLAYSSSDEEFEDSNKLNTNIKPKELNDNICDTNIFLLSATESATDTSPQNTKDNKITTDLAPLRRSVRSPNKPIRFREEQENHGQKPTKKSKTLPTNEELFGRDDDDFESNENKLSIFETAVNKKSKRSASSSSSLSAQKKRKHDKKSECEQEKRDIDKWLSKKKSTTGDKERSKEKSRSSNTLKTHKKEKSHKSDVNKDREEIERSQKKSPTPPYELPTKEELEMIRNKTKLMQQNNAIVKAELDKLRTSPPKEVEILSLQNIPLEDILNTFSTYKSELDAIYENNRKRDYVKGHDGINHCFVIRLLEQNTQMKMLEKLTDVYSNTKDSNHATLFANALLPEWIIRVYMDKFNFTRQQAIKQIKEQEDFQLHMDEQSDNSFVFD